MKKIALGLLVVLLTACADTPPPPVKLNADITPTIHLDVLTVTVLDRSPPALKGSPYITNNFQPTIANMLRQWAAERLVAIGTTGEAVVVIKDASLKSEALPHRDDMFERQQASKYTARAEIEIQVNGHGHQANVLAQASRFATLPENPTPLERKNTYTTILNGLAHDLGSDLLSGIHDNLSDFVVTTDDHMAPADNPRSESGN